MNSQAFLLLPNESRSRVDLHNHILSELSQATTLHNKVTGRWTIRIGNQQSIEPQLYWIKLESEEHSVYLGTHTSSLSVGLGDRIWSDFPKQNHPIAWTLANQQLLDHLNVLTGLDWRVASFREAGEVKTLNRYRPQIQLIWQLKLGEQEASGSLIASIATMSSWLSRITGNQLPGFQNHPKSSNTWIDSLPMHWGLFLPPIPLPVNELKEFSPGDILLHSQHRHTYENLTLKHKDHDASFNTRIENNTLYVVKYNGKPLMTDDSDSIPNIETNQIPIKLEFKVSELTLTLSELQEMNPGYTFQLPTPLDCATTDIYANGKKIGVGQLISIEEHLGIRIIGFNTDGV